MSFNKNFSKQKKLSLWDRLLLSFCPEQVKAFDAPDGKVVIIYKRMFGQAYVLSVEEFPWSVEALIARLAVDEGLPSHRTVR